MSNIITFGIEYRVLFNLPEEKVVKLRKGPEDDFDLEISGQHGTAWVKATGKINAASRVKKVFPSAEIVEAKPV
jgi:hypothetical protein